MKKTMLKHSITLILIFALLTALSLQACAETVSVLCRAKVYAAPSASAKSIVVSAGTSVEKLAEKDGWVQVEKNGYIGYMKSVTVGTVENCNSMAVYVKNATPMYKRYGRSDKYGTLPEGTALILWATTGDWGYVKYYGYKGFVRMSDLTTTAPENPTPEPEVPDSGTAKTGYAVEGAKVYQSYSTLSKVICTLPLNTAVSVTAVANGWCRVVNGSHVAFMRTDDLSVNKFESKPSAPEAEDSEDTAPDVSTEVPDNATDKESAATPAKGKAVEMDWWTSDIRSIFARGTTATITDVATGIAWKEKRTGGTNHADCQPLTAEDTAAMKSACGSWSWSRRAIFVTINGVNYAASMNCQPHGSGSITDNNFSGHHCIHFTNSRTHASNKVCSLHQAAIQRALAATL